ncbi:MAG TPA: SDR family oxidoreductase [Stenomitos sp.]
MILVIGASGRVGGELLGQFGGLEVLKLLGERDRPVRVLAQHAVQAASFEAKGLETALWAPGSSEPLEAAFSGVSRLFLVTPGSAEQVDLQLQAIRAAAKAGIQQIVKISDLGSSATSPIQHARWNWELEQAILRTGVAYTFLRADFFMQNFLLVIAPTVTAEDVFFVPSGEGRVPFVDLRDIAEVAVAALTEPGHENRVYDLTGPESLSFGDVARILSEAINRDVTYEDVAPETARETLVRSGLPDWFAHDLVELFGQVKEGLCAEVSSDVPAVTHHPARSLRDFLGEARESFQTAYV